jgi:hypothetical protein
MSVVDRQKVKALFALLFTLIASLTSFGFSYLYFSQKRLLHDYEIFGFSFIVA